MAYFKRILFFIIGTVAGCLVEDGLTALFNKEDEENEENIKEAETYYF